jgi:pyruvate dehydrogenase E1 component alpha subunit
MAAIWRLPAIFVCENNLYGASTRIDLVMKNPRVASRAASYGVEGETVDGNDVEVVHAAAERAAARCRAGDGPVLLELLTYRQTGHSRRDPRLYQPEAERKEWMARDPIETFAGRLRAEGVADAASVERMRAQATQSFAEAVEKARSAPQPSATDLETDVFAEASS